MLSLELCRYSSDIFLSSSLRTGMATAYIKGMVKARSVNATNTHTHITTEAGALLDRLDSRIRCFYSTLPLLTFAPAPIWGMQHAM